MMFALSGADTKSMMRVFSSVERAAGDIIQQQLVRLI
jgi:hypothetical protein